MPGGRGHAPANLTQHRAKPAVPFGGKFRIIDFAVELHQQRHPPHRRTDTITRVTR